MGKPRFVPAVIRRLKRRYGLPVSVYKVDAVTVDRNTGEQTQTISHVAIKRALVLDATESTKFAYDLAYVMTARDFSMGGLFTTLTRGFVLDIEDLGSFDVDQESYIVFESQKYEIKDVHRHEKDAVLYVLAKATGGVTPTQYWGQNVSQHIAMTQTIEVSHVQS